VSRKGRRFPSPSPLLKSELGKTSAIESPQNGEVRAPYSAAFLDPQVQATRTGAFRTFLLPSASFLAGSTRAPGPPATLRRAPALLHARRCLL
jgi:hypothetical protein